MSSHSINSPSLFFHKLQLKHRHSLLGFDMLPQPPIYLKRSRIFALWLMFSSRAHLEILVSLRSVPLLMKNSIIFITKNKRTMQYIYKMVNCQTTKCHLSAFFGLIPGVPWRLHLPSWAPRFSGGAMFRLWHLYRISPRVGSELHPKIGGVLFSQVIYLAFTGAVKPFDVGQKVWVVSMNELLQDLI